MLFDWRYKRFQVLVRGGLDLGLRKLWVVDALLFVPDGAATQSQCSAGGPGRAGKSLTTLLTAFAQPQMRTKVPVPYILGWKGTLTCAMLISSLPLSSRTMSGAVR